MDLFLLWSGAVAWGCFGLVGIICVIDNRMEWCINRFKFRKQFIAFVWDRSNKRNPSLTTPVG